MQAIRTYADNAATFQRRFALYLYYRSLGREYPLPLPAVKRNG